MSLFIHASFSLTLKIRTGVFLLDSTYTSDYPDKLSVYETEQVEGQASKGNLQKDINLEK